MHENKNYLPTARGVVGYAESFGMTVDEFIIWLRNRKKVLDVGSGGGLLAKEVGKKMIPTNITSLDWAYVSKPGLDFSTYSTHLTFSDLSASDARRLLPKVEKNFRQKAVAAEAVLLPFASNSFDGLVACHSIGIQSRNGQELKSALLEASRVMRKGGIGLVTVDRRLLDDEELSLRDLPFGSVELKNTNVKQSDGTEALNLFLRLRK